MSKRAVAYSMWAVSWIQRNGRCYIRVFDDYDEAAMFMEHIYGKVPVWGWRM